MTDPLPPCSVCGGKGFIREEPPGEYGPGSWRECPTCSSMEVCPYCGARQALPRRSEGAGELADHLENVSGMMSEIYEVLEPYGHLDLSGGYKLLPGIAEESLGWASRVRKLSAPEPAVQDAREWIDAMNVVKAERDSLLFALRGGADGPDVAELLTDLADRLVEEYGEDDIVTLNFSAYMAAKLVRRALR